MQSNDEENTVYLYDVPSKHAELVLESVLNLGGRRESNIKSTQELETYRIIFDDDNKREEFINSFGSYKKYFTINDEKLYLNVARVHSKDKFKQLRSVYLSNVSKRENYHDIYKIVMDDFRDHVASIRLKSSKNHEYMDILVVISSEQALVLRDRIHNFVDTGTGRPFYEATVQEVQDKPPLYVRNLPTEVKDQESFKKYLQETLKFDQCDKIKSVTSKKSSSVHDGGGERSYFIVYFDGPDSHEACKSLINSAPAGEGGFKPYANDLESKKKREEKKRERERLKKATIYATPSYSAQLVGAYDTDYESISVNDVVKYFEGIEGIKVARYEDRPLILMRKNDCGWTVKLENKDGKPLDDCDYNMVLRYTTSNLFDKWTVDFKKIISGHFIIFNISKMLNKEELLEYLPRPNPIEYFFGKSDSIKDSHISQDQLNFIRTYLGNLIQSYVKLEGNEKIREVIIKKIEDVVNPFLDERDEGRQGDN